MNRKVLAIGALVVIALAVGVFTRVGAPQPVRKGRESSAARTVPAASSGPKIQAPPARPAPKLSAEGEKALAYSRVVIEPAEGAVQVRGEEYRAQVDPSGLELKTADFSLRMTPTAVEQGAKTRALENGVPVREGANVARVIRPEVVEEYIFENRRVEQLFRFDRPPGEGELRVKIAVQGGLDIEKVPANQSLWRDTALLDGGLLFKRPDGKGVMAYHGAVVIDAAGRRETLYPDVQDGQIVLAVPDTFMATAAFPLVIDPWLELNLSAQGGGISLTSKVSEGLSLALDGSGNPHVAWSDNTFGNFDIYYRYFNGFEWKSLGTSMSPGGVSNNAGKSSHPSLALGNGGTPMIAWDDDTSGDFEINLRRWNGTTWQSIAESATDTRGLSGQAGLSLHPSVGVMVAQMNFPSAPAVEFEEVPIVAWQQDEDGVSDIYVAFYFPGDEDSDEGWYPLSSGYNISNTPLGVSENPVLAMDDFSRPFVAWHDTQNGNFEIYLRGFFTEAAAPALTLDGRIRVTVTGGIYDQDARALLSSGYLSGGGSGVEVAGVWGEVQGSGSGGGISGTAGPSFYPSLTFEFATDAIYVAWQEGPTTQPPPAPPLLNTNVYMRRALRTGGVAASPATIANYGAAWAELGGSATGGGISGTGRGLKPSIAVVNGAGVPVVAWQDDTSPAGVGTIGNPEIFVRQFLGGVWQDVGDAGSTIVQGGISATSSLSFSPQLRQAGQGQFLCAWTDGALGAFDVFVKKFFVTDLAQISLDQLDLGGTQIAVGGNTPDTTVRLRANVRGESLVVPAVTGVRAQFEVRPIGTPFIGTPTVETSLGTPTNAVGAGNVVEALFNGAPNVMYAWRGRAVDQIGRVGPWQSFGGNGDSVIDFEVRQTIPTPAPAGLDQRRLDQVTQIPLGATTSESSVVLIASIVPPDASTTVQLEVEVQPIGTAFTQTATAVSAPVSGAATIVLAHPALNNGSYHWRARTVPQAGSISPASGWISFGGNPDGQADFVIQSPVPATLEQRLLDGLTTLPVGATSPESGVTLLGTVTAPTPGVQVRLEVELRPTGAPFTGTPTHQGNLVASGQVSTITITGLGFDSYHWRARTTTAANSSSAWVSFPLPPAGNADGQADFTLFVAPVGPSFEDKDKCGLTGLEAFLLAGLLAFRRRRR